jgi:hypothetical protein
VLMCQARPCSDVEIAPKRIEKRAPPLRKTLTATVYRIARRRPMSGFSPCASPTACVRISRPASICRY